MSYLPLTLEKSAERIRTGEDPWICVREFMDDFYAASQDERSAMIRDEPPRTGDERIDAYLGALGEHFAVRYGLPAPPWTADPSRFLPRFWFPTSIKALHATAIVQSPAAFRRRGIFVDDTEFQRV